MIHLFKSIAAQVWIGVLLLVVLAGMLVGTARLLLPLAETFREPLAERIGAVLGAPVHIGGLGARLAGLAPELRLTEVEIRAPGGDAPLRLKELRLRFDPLTSLRSGTLQLSWVTVVGARLVAHVTPGQGLSLGLASTTASTAMSPALLLTQGRLQLLDGELLLERPGAPSLRFQGVEAQLLNAGDRHQLDLDARLDDHDALQVKADVQGPPARPAEGRGRVYIKTDGLALAPLLAPWLPPATVLSGTLDAELWGSWGAERETALNGQLALRDLALSTSGAPHSLALRLAARMDLRRGATGTWMGGLYDLAWERDGQSQTHPGAEIGLRLHWPQGVARPVHAPVGAASSRDQTPVGAASSRDPTPVVGAASSRDPTPVGAASSRDPTPWLQIAAAGLWLDDLANLAAALPLPEDWRVTLARLAPHGQASDLRLSLTLPPGDAPVWAASGRILGLASTPWKKIPGLHGLDLEFRAAPAGGMVRLASRDLEVRLPRLFRWPLQALHLAGDLAWRPQPNGGLQFDSDELILENPDLRTRSRLSLRLPGDGGAPFIDMQSDFRDGKGTATSRYLPVGIMSKTLVAWLDRAIVSGRVPSGSFLLRGPADAFPFRGQEGRFEVLFGVEDLILDYQEQWPRLEEVMGELRFLGPGLSIELREGKLLESEVRGAHALVADLHPARHLPISGRVVGPFADALRILRETPLAQHQGRYVKGMHAQGDSEVTLDLGIPIEPDASPQVDGRVRWRQAALRLDDWGLALERLKGSLRFNDQGIFAQGLQAQLWGEFLRLDVDTPPPRKGVPDATHIDLDLALTPAPLATHYPHGLWETLVGSAPAHLRLVIEHADHSLSDLPLRYRLESDLRGLAVRLPEPLGKIAEASRPFYLKGSLPLGADNRLDLGYGDLQAAFRFSAARGAAPQLLAGEVLNGLARAPAPKRPGLHVSGRLARLDTLAWVDWIDHHGGPLAHPTATSAGPTTRVDLHIGELGFAQGTLRDLDIALAHTTDAWEADLRAPQLAGHVRVPDLPRSHPVQLRLARLRLDLPEESTDEGAKAAPSRAKAELPDPRQAPALDLQIERLQLGEQPLGRLLVQAHAESSGLRLTQIELDGPLLTLVGTGAWSGTQEAQETRLHLEGKGSDLGETLRAMGFTSALSEANLSVQADLHWPAPPQYLELAQLAGELQFHLGKGRVLDVNPGVGRLFGLLNLEALRRRLTLDFSDLFGKGYAFDHMDGRFTLRGGDAFAQQMAISGPAADLAISGRTGLVAQDYDQVVTVTPEISATLPVAGAIAGGPVAAAALLVAGQVMGKQMNRLIRLQYRVTGPWKEPEITRIQTQDGWSLSNLLAPDATPPAPPATAKAFVH